MTGLIIKDLQLLKAQKLLFLAFFATSIYMQLFMDNASFVIGYMTFCGYMAVLNTISYDEYDNGNSFLFSLPISRKGYVLEKYTLGFIIGGSAWLLAVVVSAVISIAKHSFSAKDLVPIAIMYLALLAILMAIMLPIQLKFGSEKRFFVIFIIFGLVLIIAGIAFGITHLLKIDLDSVLSRLSAVSGEILASAIIVIALLALLLSYRISVGIMNKKEF